MNSNQQIVLAKEIKTNFYFLLIASIIGLSSYFINKSSDKVIPLYQSIERKWEDVKSGNLYPDDNLIDETKSMGCYASFLNDRPDASGILDTIQYNIGSITEPYKFSALKLGLIVLGILVLGRYVLRLGSWVNKTAK